MIEWYSNGKFTQEEDDFNYEEFKPRDRIKIIDIKNAYFDEGRKDFRDSLAKNGVTLGHFIKFQERNGVMCVVIDGNGYNFPAKGYYKKDCVEKI